MLLFFIAIPSYGSETDDDSQGAPKNQRPRPTTAPRDNNENPSEDWEKEAEDLMNWRAKQRRQPQPNYGSQASNTAGSIDFY